MTPRTYQAPVLTSKAIDDLTVSAPQLGKTVTGESWLLGQAWLTRGLWWWTAPTYSQVKHAFGGSLGLLYMARSAGILRGYTGSPSPEITLSNGSIIQGRSWERPESMYGPTILGAVVDEFGQLTFEGYGAISSRRAETISRGFGQVRYLGNVGSVGGPAEELWNQAERGDPGFACRRWTWLDRALDHVCACDQPTTIEAADLHAATCARGIYLRFVSREASRMSEPQFRQLYGAEWLDWNTLPVYQFSREIHESTEAEYDPALPVELSCDFNVDPMVWVLGQHHGERIWDFDEIVLPGGATTPQACSEFKRRHPDPKTPVVVYGDATGRRRGTRDKRSDYELIREILGSYYRQFSIEVPRQQPPVKERTNAVNGRMAPALGAPTYSVHPRCVTLTKDWARVSKRPGTDDIDKTNKQLTHASDAAGYRIVRLFPVRPESGRVLSAVPRSHIVPASKAVY